MKYIELFGGAGGLALGASHAGFECLAFIEMERHSCDTIRANKVAGHDLAVGWPLLQTDVRGFDYRCIEPSVDLLSAGVPCQPFSVAGKSRGHADHRNLFLEVARAAREMRPKAILVENVRGLLRSRFSDYLDYLRLALTYPDIARGEESWQDHLKCLKRSDTAFTALRYDVYVHTVNAADYGVPQWRERVFIIAFRSDLRVSWSLPAPTHSIDALIRSQLAPFEYWRRHALKKPSGHSTRRYQNRRHNLQDGNVSIDDRLPWLTVRDAIGDLPTLRGRRRVEIDGHYLNPGARTYPGHTGSLLDEPAKTLKAGSHGVPGGENILVLPSGRVRYFSIRECARLQTFPDAYTLAGPWSRAIRQLGNAVPVTLATKIVSAIKHHLLAAVKSDEIDCWSRAS